MSELEYWTQRFVSRRISRRELMGRAGALGLSAGAVGALLTRAAAAQAPTSGGTLRLGMSGGATTDSLDPSTYTDWVPVNTAYQVYNGLIEVDEKNVPQGEIFESWEPLPGAKEWIFNIRQGVEFHDGKSLTAEDVLYSINVHRGDASTSAAKAVLAPITDVRIESPTQIRVVLDSGYADLPYLLSDYHIMVMKDGFADWSNPIGTGGYKMVSFDPGVLIVTERNPSYWKAGRAHVDSIELSVINDGTARSSALQSGEIHVMNRVDRKIVDRLGAVEGIEIVRSAGGQHYVALMACDKAPFTDNNIRLALKYGIDRQQLLDTILRGYGKVGNDHPIPETDVFHNGDLPQYAFDADKAKFYLKQAGLETLDVTLQTSEAAFAEAVDTALLFQDSAARAGININVQREASDGYWENVWMKVPFCMSYWGGRPVADMILSIAYKSDAPWNDTAWKNETFDKLLIEARAELDTAKRKEMYGEMQRLIHDEGGAIIPMFADFLDAKRDEVKGFVPSPVFDFSGQRLGEKVWLDPV